jgi:ubiquinone/menaquinone biosynthesis C-methylase UbiE
MSGRVCPWWLGYLLVAPIRRLFQDPARILAPHLAEGMTVVEPGSGMGFFTLEIARRVGAAGRVVAVDVQPRMLAGLRRRAERAALGARIETRLAKPDRLGVDDLHGKVDLVLAFAVVHEMPDAQRFLEEAARLLKPGGRLLLAEPRGHVAGRELEATLVAAEGVGLRVRERPAIRGSWAAVLVRA